MSDYELRQKVNRLRLENDYRYMLASQAPKPKKSLARRFISSISNDVIKPAVKDAGRKILSNFIVKKMEKNNNDIYTKTRKEAEYYTNVQNIGKGLNSMGYNSDSKEYKQYMNNIKKNNPFINTNSIKNTKSNVKSNINKNNSVNTKIENNINEIGKEINRINRKTSNIDINKINGDLIKKNKKNMK
jgi:hypothetical protein